MASLMGVKIDNTTYNVRVVAGSLVRNFELVSGQNAGQNMLFEDIPDVVGTRFNYSIDVRPDPADPTSYDNFYAAITDPSTPIHAVEFPYAQTVLSFDARIVSGSDSLVMQLAKNRWSGLTVNFIAAELQRQA